MMPLIANQHLIYWGQKIIKLKYYKLVKIDIFSILL